MTYVILFDVCVVHQDRKESKGIYILKKFRHNTLNDDVKEILRASIDLRDECLNIGVDDFIIKPKMPNELIGKLGARLM